MFVRQIMFCWDWEVVTDVSEQFCHILYFTDGGCWFPFQMLVPVLLYTRTPVACCTPNRLSVEAFILHVVIPCVILQLLCERSVL
jgi:hypothetical protein